MQVCCNLLEGTELEPLFDVDYTVCIDELVVGYRLCPGPLTTVDLESVGDKKVILPKGPSRRSSALTVPESD
ncbi:hypothetical protein H4V95_002066 [Arthrobacter sp. CAN_C5]|nr:hypothetical protein [Arthrobacter sp. CAN_C5]